MAVIVNPHPSSNPSGVELGPARAITYLRISITDRCNLRCQYCMPEDQTFFERDSVLSFEEISAIARHLVARGVDKIRITGGEPLVRREVVALVEMLRGLSDDLQLVMTTNAMLFERHARDLRAAGLDRINVSLDTLRADRFEQLARRPGLDAALAGIDAAHAAGFENTKTNMVVMGGINDDEIPAMLDFAAERGIEQRFLEFMPLTSNDYGVRAERVPVGEIRRRIEAHGGTLVPRTKGSGPADTFVLERTGQKVGIIAAISLPFCETCNRVRLTADGRLRSCLFEGGEVQVRDLLRSTPTADHARVLDETLDYLSRVKPPVHDGLGHVQMNQVGG